MNHHGALALCLRMIFSEGRCALFEDHALNALHCTAQCVGIF